MSKVTSKFIFCTILLEKTIILKKNIVRHNLIICENILSIRIFIELIKSLCRFHFYNYSENMNLHIYPQSNQKFYMILYNFI